MSRIRVGANNHSPLQKHKTFELIRVIRGQKKHKKPVRANNYSPLPGIAQMPQISTKIFDENEYIHRGSSPALNMPFSHRLPENLLYCGIQKMAFNAVSTLLTPFFTRLTPPKTKNVMKVQESQKDQTRFFRVFNFSPPNTRIYTKKGE